MSEAREAREARDELDAAVFSTDLPTRERKEPPLGIGGSAIAYLAVAFGHRAPEEAPRWIREKARPMPRHGGLPRGLAQLLGLAAQDRGATLDTGTRREPELLAAWIERLERGEWTCELEREIDPSTIQWAGALPWEWVEHADPKSPLVVHPDGWAHTWRRKLVTFDTKVARYGFAKPAWWNGATETPWYYGTQLDAYAAVMRSERHLLVVGCGWNRDADDSREDGPILALPHESTAEGVEMARAIARKGWDLIQPWISRAHVARG